MADIDNIDNNNPEGDNTEQGNFLPEGFGVNDMVPPTQANKEARVPYFPGEKTPSVL